MAEEPMEPCISCGTPVPWEAFDVLCPPCLDQLYEALAQSLADAWLGRWRGDLMHRRVRTGDRRWWVRRLEAG